MVVFLLLAVVAKAIFDDLWWANIYAKQMYMYVLSTGSLLLRHPNSLVHAGGDEYMLTVRLHELHHLLKHTSCFWGVAWCFLSCSVWSRSQFSVSVHTAVLRGYMYVHTVRTHLASQRQKHGDEVFSSMNLCSEGNMLVFSTRSLYGIYRPAIDFTKDWYIASYIKYSQKAIW